MNNIKFFEQYNKPSKEETLLGLAKMGLRTNRKEVFDLAVSRGFNPKDYRFLITGYCADEIFNFNSLEWIFEDKDKYQRYINSITRLNCYDKNLTDLKGIEKLKNLIYLDCSNNLLFDLKGVENFPQLKRLQCENNSITSLEGIETLIELNQLDCNNNKITTLKGIELLTNLGELYCSNNSLPHEIEEILIKHYDDFFVEYDHVPMIHDIQDYYDV